MHKLMWSSTHPGLMILLIDQSATTNTLVNSMIAHSANSLLHGLIKSNTIHTEVKPRIDIVVLGYSEGGVSKALKGNLGQKDSVDLAELMSSPIHIEQESRLEMDESGNMIRVPLYFPIWIEPSMSGSSPMCAALKCARQIANEWVKKHPDRFPPIAVNFTGGVSSDGDPVKPAYELCSVSTKLGETFLFNFQVADAEIPSVEFPSNDTQVPIASMSRLLFHISSSLPDDWIDWCSSLPIGVILGKNVRCYFLNGSANSISRLCSSLVWD